jgi:hypothetical protein
VDEILVAIRPENREQDWLESVGDRFKLQAESGSPEQ